jgi:hypothetical protein
VWHDVWIDVQQAMRETMLMASACGDRCLLSGLLDKLKTPLL